MTLNLKRLRAERIAKGMNQDEMAKAMGWHTRSSYAKRENGITTISATELVKMASILGYGANQLDLFFTDNVPDRERKGMTV
ncbi:XRE family transcriptional regulator [Lacticaseibacillus paracasei]|jgi:transcriptional regulator with XRE-family HTH domain|uniref:helix-turn-helix domain-containing protein n=1 Tax=Lacticaseibacillus paracasei TaxID=1597 RepID=UPI000343B2AF|nr:MULTISPECIES: helix-turn-helix transcriptional regulator [Lacticaseibacillus]EPC39997.1 bacteriophage repressor [Lacticaseibacillus paracasei subsp. paracasei Lpp219]DAZ24785.1 MAG TPA: helix-turn-helix domain protein [Caudoviricetes sp.]KMO88362.1 Cro/Cl family transcriptional regulator [Lacticaseibacillus rhamnosus]PCL24436.1 XRE family transcriptional regulator [Lacticaseibacillus paracasei]PCL35243.1 XRE family transcriptional regulator [Lacticaseibacillus paracasei]